LRRQQLRKRRPAHAAKNLPGVEGDDLGGRTNRLRLDLLVSSTKLQPIFFASICGVDLAAPRRPFRAMPENALRRWFEWLPPRESTSWPARSAPARACAYEIAEDAQSGAARRRESDLPDARPSRSRQAQQHDRAVALAALSLSDL